MPRYDDLEHDSHEAAGSADAAVPPGLSSPTDAGDKPPADNPVSRLRERAKADREREWCSEDNPAIWTGDADWDD